MLLSPCRAAASPARQVLAPRKAYVRTPMAGNHTRRSMHVVGLVPHGLWLKAHAHRSLPMSMAMAAPAHRSLKVLPPHPIHDSQWALRASRSRSLFELRGIATHGKLWDLDATTTYSKNERELYNKAQCGMKGGWRSTHGVISKYDGILDLVYTIYF